MTIIKTTSHKVSPETQKRIMGIVREGLRLQLSRDVLTAARAAQEPGKPLEHYVRSQCEWRGIDPAPYLAQIEQEGDL